MGVICGGDSAVKLKITGSKPLSGLVKVGGAKNAALKIMAASLLANGPCQLMGVPQIADVNTWQVY